MTNLQTILQRLAEFVATNPENRPAELVGTEIYDAPLVAIASANDPLWNDLQKPDIVGPQHWLPEQWLPGVKSVISYFLPFTEAVRQTNRIAGEPSHEWLVARYEGEVFNTTVRRFLVELIQEAGGEAVSPGLDERQAVVNLRSNWSERHVAFIAGLGTFSLNRSLITSRGSAGRLGSAVTTLELEPTPRPYTRHDDYCINCGYCIPRCPPRAISMEGKDNALCLSFLNQVKERHQPRYGCGKCQTAVPCEAVNPMQG